MAKQETILEPQKARIVISEGSLPRVSMTRQTFLRSINELLGRCLAECDINAVIVIGVEDDSVFVEGRPKKYRRQRWKRWKGTWKS
jgi:hypothetical protein